jgi:DNA-binding IclR family transcriptional regulator
MSERGPYYVARTIETLELLATGPRSVAQIAELLVIHPRTARRTLHGLVEAGYVNRALGVRGRFGLAPRFVELAARVTKERNAIEM